MGRQLTKCVIVGFFCELLWDMLRLRNVPRFNYYWVAILPIFVELGEYPVGFAIPLPWCQENGMIAQQRRIA